MATFILIISSFEAVNYNYFTFLIFVNTSSIITVSSVCYNRFSYFSEIHGFHFQLELFFYALLFFTKHKNVIDRDIDVSLMIFSTYILPNLRCVNNHYSLFLFFL